MPPSLPMHFPRRFQKLLMVMTDARSQHYLSQFFGLWHRVPRECIERLVAVLGRGLV